MLIASEPFGLSHTRTYYKCLLRGVSSGAATDHRKRWLACAAYVPRPPGERP